MSTKRQKIQLELALVTRTPGEAEDHGNQGVEAHMAARPTERPAMSDQLMEEVLERENLKKAMKRVQANKGAPGVDGMTVDELPDYLREHWPTIKVQLLSGTYKPQPVRRVEIPKPSGGTRNLGVPTVVDRWLQQAVLQVLQRQWDPTFSEHSYGFRPGRSAHQAIAQAQRYVREGYTVVVDLDLEKFYDLIVHDRLMARVAERVTDKRVLKLIRAFLKAGVLLENGLVSPTEMGTPQGGPLSPLLSNLILDELDRELERRGHRFCRYADDVNVYVRSERAGQRVMESISSFITRRLKLRVNSAKSKVATASECEFLGFTFTWGPTRKRTIGPKAVRRFKGRVRELTRRTRGTSIQRVVADLSRYLRGWLAYFGFSETVRPLEDLDSWIRRRLRCLIWKQWKTFRKRRAGLMERGIEEAPASQTAARSRGCWSTSNVPPLRRAFPIAYFDSLGLPRLLGRRA
jgi:RNA-directed DNA polymerase